MLRVIQDWDQTFMTNSMSDNGATICTVDEVLECDIILNINKPSQELVSKLSSSQTFISFFSPATNPDMP